MYLNKLFVYGTLLPGLPNHQKFIEKYQPQVYKATIKGTMYYLPEGNYPVVVEGNTEIKGVIFETKELPVILPELDEIEKFTGVESQSHLIREIRDVVNVETGTIVKAHMFMWPPTRIAELKEKGTVISDGDWVRFLQQNQK